MDSLIREVNENLKTIIDNLKENVDNSTNTLDNIQIQMDKKVEEAKKYKIQVDAAKDRIRELEEDNKSLELSLKELQYKYGKMNLISVIEAGNKEIKSKTNDNIREINKQKEHISELTSKARTIKDLLLNLKKDKTLKEEKLENLKVVYSFYSDKLNSIMDYAFNHSENLMDYKDEVIVNEDEEVEINDTSDLDNTMVFDEIASIDENKNFKDEMSFISDKIEDTIVSDNKLFEEDNLNIDETNDEYSESSVTSDYYQFISEENDNNEEEDKLEKELEKKIISNDLEENSDANIFNSDIFHVEEVKNNEPEIEEEKVFENETFENNFLTNSNLGFENVGDNNDVFTIKGLDVEESKDTEVHKEEYISDDSFEDNENNFSELESNDLINNLENFKLESNNEEELDELEIDDTRINKINDLFSSINDTKTSSIPLDNISKVENQIDNAYVDIFGKPLEESDLNKKESTLTDIFGNPISKEEVSESVKTQKKIEELFVENGIDFNKFKEDEQSYLKQIYDEEKFISILEVLKKHKINLDNIYYSFNIFGEISSFELDSLISKLINIGQSVESIGMVLEKLPKVKKYNLDDAIMSYGDYVNNVDITELIIKAKELYDNGGNL
ncbi:MAG: hypothetical protein IJD92_00410 [Bacilli bacterium]|nr:hypothetical protein [Bacilli bacterium]